MSVRVRVAGAGTSPYAMLRGLGAGRVTPRPGRAPWAEHGHVSVSRTDGMVVVAASAGPVGIDVERLAPLPDLDRLVADHLGEVDAARVRAAADPTTTFYETWTHLEALLKAEGTGIVDGLDPPPGVRARWRVRPLRVGQRHRGALAVPATDLGDVSLRRAP